MRKLLFLLPLVVLVFFTTYASATASTSYEEKVDNYDLSNEENLVENQEINQTNIAYLDNDNTKLEPINAESTNGENFSYIDPVVVESVDGDQAIVSQNLMQYQVDSSDLYFEEDYALPYYEVKNDKIYVSYPKDITNEDTTYYPSEYIGTNSNLEEDTKYYSVDTYTFYTNPQDIGLNTLATQKYSPAEMSYYKHQSIRTTSNITPEEINQYINYVNAQYKGRANSGSCMYQNNDSALYKDKETGKILTTGPNSIGHIIKQAEATFGINAVFMLSVSMHESCYGFSNYALSRNNFWGWGAYDSDPNKARGFADASSAFYAYAGYLSDYYSDPSLFVGNGMQIGDNPDGVINTGESNINNQDCSGTPSSTYTYGNIDGTEDGIGRYWATGCSWQYGVASKYADIDAYFGKQDLYKYKTVSANGNSTLYVKDTNGNYVVSRDGANKLENDNAKNIQYSYTVVGDAGNYWQVIPNGVFYNNKINTSYQISNDCSGGQKSSTFNSTKYLIQCTGVKKTDYYGSKSTFYEYQLVPNSTWGKYGMQSANTKQYVPKSNVIKTYASTSTKTPTFGSLSIAGGYYSSTHVTGQKLYDANNVAFTGDAIVVTFDYYAHAPNNVNYNLKNLPSLRIVGSNNVVTTISAKNLVFSDANTVVVKVPLKYLASGVDYHIELKPSTSEAQYNELSSKYSTWFNLYTNKPNQVIKNSYDKIISYANVGNTANLSNDKTSYTIKQYLTNSSLKTKQVLYDQNNKSYTGDAINVTFDYQYKSNNNLLYNIKNLPSVRLMNANGNVVNIGSKNVKFIDSNTISINIPASYISLDNKYNLQLKTNSNETYYSYLTPTYQNWINLYSAKSNAVLTSNATTQINALNASNKLTLSKTKVPYKVNAKFISAVNKNKQQYYTSSTTSVNTNVVEVTFDYAEINKTTNKVQTLKYLPAIKISSTDGKSSFTINYKNITRVDNDTLKVKIPSSFLNKNTTYLLQVKPSAKQSYYNNFETASKNFSNLRNNVTNSVIKTSDRSLNFINNKNILNIKIS